MVYLHKRVDYAKRGKRLSLDLQGQMMAVGGGGGAGHVPEHGLEELMKAELNNAKATENKTKVRIVEATVIAPEAAAA